MEVNVLTLNKYMISIGRIYKFLATCWYLYDIFALNGSGDIYHSSPGEQAVS